MRIGVGLSIPELATRGGRFSPASLFTSGVAGAWYDPSDTSTLFQDSAGTTPVTAVEQPVGLMLDKSQGLVLGSELVTNGDFSGGSTGWTLQTNVSVASGQLVFASTSSTLGARQDVNVVSGRRYQITYTIVSISLGALATRIGGTTQDVQRTSAGTYTESVEAVGSGLQSFGLIARGVTTAVVDNISVKEIPGNHASQATAASRPILRARYNLLTYSEQFDNAAWTKAAGVTVTANTDVAPDGTTTADTISSIGLNEVTQGYTGTSGFVYRVSVSVKKTTSATTFPMIALNGSAVFGQVILNTNTGVASVRTGVPGATGVTSESQGNFWRVAFSLTADTASLNFKIYPAASTDGTSFGGTGIGSAVVWGADLRTGSSAGTYQRIAAATDYATAGFLPYLAGDGVDDQMVIPTAAISGATAITELHGAWRPTGFASGNGVIFGGIGTGLTNDHEPFSDNFLYYGFASTARQDFGSLGTVTTPYILDATQTGTTLAAFKNNAQLSTTKTVALGIGTTPRLFVSNNATLQYYTGNLFGGVLIQKVLSASEMASLRSWMAAKSGVTL